MKKAAIINKATHYKVAIVQESSGWTRILKDGVWVNHTYETTEDEILVVSKCFHSEEYAQQFINSKPFQRLMKLVEKGGFQ